MDRRRIPDVTPGVEDPRGGGRCVAPCMGGALQPSLAPACDKRAIALSSGLPLVEWFEVRQTSSDSFTSLLCVGECRNPQLLSRVVSSSRSKCLRAEWLWVEQPWPSACLLLTLATNHCARRVWRQLVGRGFDKIKVVHPNCGAHWLCADCHTLHQWHFLTLDARRLAETSDCVECEHCSATYLVPSQLSFVFCVVMESPKLLAEAAPFDAMRQLSIEEPPKVKQLLEKLAIGSVDEKHDSSHVVRDFRKQVAAHIRDRHSSARSRASDEWKAPLIDATGARRVGSVQRSQLTDFDDAAIAQALHNSLLDSTQPKPYIAPRSVQPMAVDFDIPKLEFSGESAVSPLFGGGISTAEYCAKTAQFESAPKPLVTHKVKLSNKCTLRSFLVFKHALGKALGSGKVYSYTPQMSLEKMKGLTEGHNCGIGHKCKYCRKEKADDVSDAVSAAVAELGSAKRGPDAVSLLNQLKQALESKGEDMSAFGFGEALPTRIGSKEWTVDVQWPAMKKRYEGIGQSKKEARKSAAKALLNCLKKRPKMRRIIESLSMNRSATDKVTSYGDLSQLGRCFHEVCTPEADEFVRFFRLDAAPKRPPMHFGMESRRKVVDRKNEVPLYEIEGTLCTKRTATGKIKKVCPPMKHALLMKQRLVNGQWLKLKRRKLEDGIEDEKEIEEKEETRTVRKVDYDLLRAEDVRFWKCVDQTYSHKQVEKRELERRALCGVSTSPPPPSAQLRADDSVLESAVKLPMPEPMAAELPPSERRSHASAEPSAVRAHVKAHSSSDSRVSATSGKKRRKRSLSPPTSAPLENAEKLYYIWYEFDELISAKKQGEVVLSLLKTHLKNVKTDFGFMKVNFYSLKFAGVELERQLLELYSDVVLEGAVVWGCNSLALLQTEEKCHNSGILFHRSEAPTFADCRRMRLKKVSWQSEDECRSELSAVLSDIKVFCVE